jgi:DNA-binding MurR/RpiR family transcriptional regulator
MRTAEKIDAVQNLVLSQEDRPQTHRSTRQISRETGISQPTVVRIIHEYLKLKRLKKRHAQQLTKCNKDLRLDRCKKL